MSEASSRTSSAPDSPAEAGRGMFGLAAEEAAIVRDACAAALAARGVDGTALFDRLDAGLPLGEALGVSKAICEQLYERAHRWFAVGHAGKAEPLFRALCTLDGTDTDYWVGLGICLRLRDDRDGAALAFATAERLRANWAVPVFHAAELALRGGDLAAADAKLRRFAALKDETTPPHMVAEAARLSQAVSLRRQSDGSILE